MDESQFRKGIRSQDPAAWAELHRRHASQLLRRARSIVSRGGDADDAMGEVWLLAYREAKRYDPSRPPLPWLSKICLRACLTQNRRWSRFLGRPLAGDPEAPPLRTERGHRAAREALRAAIRTLPQRPREVLALRFLFGLSTRDTALVLHLRPSSVRQHAARGAIRLSKGRTAPEFDAWMDILQDEEQL
jgi:RNA polymerase sigma factor (sigma-70 family)